MEIKLPVSVILKAKGSHVHSTHPESTVIEAVRLMNQKKIGALVILHQNQPIGMFTERDVLLRIVDAGRNPNNTRVREVMTENLVVINPDSTIEDTMRIMSQKRCRHLPVLENERLCGLISIGDLMRWLVREHEAYIENLLDYISGRYPS